MRPSSPSLLATLLMPLLLAACSSPPHQLPDRGESKTFTVALASDVAYRRVVEGARTCYSKWEVTGDFFTDNKTGRVSMSAKTSYSIAALVMAEISPLEGGARIQVFYLKGNPVFAEAVEAWTKGNYSMCPFT